MNPNIEIKRFNNAIKVIEEICKKIYTKFNKNLVVHKKRKNILDNLNYIVVRWIIYQKGFDKNQGILPYNYDDYDFKYLIKDIFFNCNNL